MGGIWTSRKEVITTLGEIVGFKAGLALNRMQILKRLKTQGVPFGGKDNAVLRIRSEEFEDMVSRLLYSVGNVKTPIAMPAGVAMFHKYEGDPELLKTCNDVQALFVEMFDQLMKQAEIRGDKRLDPKPYLAAAIAIYGETGLKMAFEFVESFADAHHRNPWVSIRRFSWNDVRDLEELFASERLSSQYGQFFDQRFVDYLARNFDEIGAINWRQFEGLTCEFFDRLGFHVQIGPGRADGGVDARVWPHKEDETKPPALLIQCKRYREDVQDVYVKALYADILNEKAEAGLIVTTSRLSPGARTTCAGRAYPIIEINREPLKAWVEAMRTPWTGVSEI